MDVWRSPKPVLKAHAPDQCPQFARDGWPSSAIPGFPAPVATKAGPMPAQQRLRLDDRHCLQDRREPAIKLDEEQPIAVRELDATAHLALQNDQLLSERGILCFKPELRPAW